MATFGALLDRRGETLVEGIHVGGRGAHVGIGVSAEALRIHLIDLLGIVDITVFLIVEPAALGQVQVEFVDLLVDLQRSASSGMSARRQTIRPTPSMHWQYTSMVSASVAPLAL